MKGNIETTDRNLEVKKSEKIVNKRRKRKLRKTKY